MNDSPVASGMSAVTTVAPVVAIDQPGRASRAEYPPLHYWRRWSSDAPAASAPQVEPAPDVADDDGLDPDPAAHVPFRVLVVEDDASQALFAAGVLNGAGIQAQIACDRASMLTALARFEPDLVLMDLHLPGTSGIELTTAIRSDRAFAHLPVVFLTGDMDPDRQIEVLENGGDDFLAKPIKPRHLIAAVQSRIRRARALQEAHQHAAERHPVTGLHTRGYLLQHIATAIAGGSAGSALLVELQNTGALHERYGYAGFEQLMLDAAQCLGVLAGACPVARLNDNAFLLLALDDPQPPEAVATRLRDCVGKAAFELAGMPHHLVACVGYASLQHGFADAGSVLDALEHAVRTARSQGEGVSEWHPPAATADSTGQLVERMRHGLHVGGFELMFQPVVAVVGGEEAQYQVLLRLRDEDGEIHNAGELVPVAESSGLMPEIDRWVLERSIDLLHRRQVEQRPVRLFVSQSALTLARDLHADWLQQTLASHDIAGPSLVIDLRLADALVHSLTLRRFCEQLMPTGVQFCLSQYAQGAEADALLPQLPLGYVRLAPRYSHAHANGRLRDELRAVIERAHRLGLQVIGPQVEDPQGAATLWMSGIDYIQGNLVQQALGGLDFDFQHSVL